MALRRFFFFFNDPATTEIYTLPLHDALPISCLSFTPGAGARAPASAAGASAPPAGRAPNRGARRRLRSEEHTSELQSPCNLVCRLLLEKKKKELYTRAPSTVRYSFHRGHTVY